MCRNQDSFHSKNRSSRCVVVQNESQLETAGDEGRQTCCHCTNLAPAGSDLPWRTLQETYSYKEAFKRLRDLKPQIEQLQSLLNRHRSQTDAAATAPNQSSVPEKRDGTGAGAAAQQPRGPTDVNNQDAVPLTVSMLQPASASRRTSATALHSSVDDSASPGRPEQANISEGDTR